jgi:hypothetical protein
MKKQNQTLILLFEIYSIIENLVRWAISLEIGFAVTYAVE